MNQIFKYIKSSCHHLLIPKLSLDSTPQMWAPSFMGGKEKIFVLSAPKLDEERHLFPLGKEKPVARLKKCVQILMDPHPHKWRLIVVKRKGTCWWRCSALYGEYVLLQHGQNWCATYVGSQLPRVPFAEVICTKQRADEYKWEGHDPWRLL